MMDRSPILLSLAAALFVTACSGERDEASTGNAAMPMPENGMMTMGMTPAPGDSPATRGYKQSMNDMMADMPAFTGEPDEDFMRQMKGITAPPSRWRKPSWNTARIPKRANWRKRSSVSNVPKSPRSTHGWPPGVKRLDPDMMSGRI